MLRVKLQKLISVSQVGGLALSVTFGDSSLGEGGGCEQSEQTEGVQNRYTFYGNYAIL